MPPEEEEESSPFSSSPSEPLPGVPSQLGPYQCIGPLRRRHDHWRCLARDIRLQRTLILSLRPVGSSELTSDIFARAQRQAAHGHPGLATIYDLGSEGPWEFVACEHLEGMPLPQWLNATRRSWRDILDVFAAVLRTMAALERAAPRGGSSACAIRFCPDDIVVDARGRARFADVHTCDAAAVSRGARMGEIVETLRMAMMDASPPPPRWLSRLLAHPEDAARRWPTWSALAQACSDRMDPRPAFDVRALAWTFLALFTSAVWSPWQGTSSCARHSEHEPSTLLEEQLVQVRDTLGSSVADHYTWLELSAYGEQWQQRWESHRRQHFHDEAEHDCLEAQHVELTTWLELWPSGDPTIRALAPRASAELGYDGVCPTASDPELGLRDRSFATSLRRGLARARVLSQLDRRDEALGLVLALRLMTLHRDSVPLTAESGWTLGVLHRDRGATRLARAHFEEALWLAETVQYGTLVARVTADLVGLSGEDAHAETWLRHARAGLAPQGVPTWRTTRLNIHEARILRRRGQHAAARARLEQALRTRGATPHNPFDTVAVHRELAALALEEQDFEAARVHALHQRWFLELRLGFDHPLLADLDLQAADLALALHRPMEADDWVSQGLRRVSRQGGGLQRVEMQLRSRRAQAQQLRGDLRAAATTWRRLVETPLAESSLDRATATHQLARTLHALGEVRAARDAYAQAVALGEARFGPRHPELGAALTDWGRLELESGRPFEALEKLEEALQLRSGRHIDPALLAETQYTLAQALAQEWESDPRARQLAATAAETFRPRDAHRSREIERWLAQFPGPTALD